MNLIILPEIVLEHIFSFLSYDNIAQNRVVCKKFNEVGSKMLNKGYYAADRFHGRTLKSIKAKLPRRESERRAHPLARQCDILIAIETRLSMLAMTFTKWMDAKLCCFIPGKVIDEIMRVLRCVANNPNPPRAHEILQELRDISSMAMEHFDEKILPSLRLNLGSSNHFHQVSVCKGSGLLLGSSRTDDELAHLVPMKRSSHDGKDEDTATINLSVAEFNKLLLKEAVNSKKLKAQSELLAKQGNEISELRKHVEEWEAKLRDLTTNLIKSKDLPSTSSTATPKATSTPIVPCQESRKRRIISGKIAATSKKRKQAAFSSSSSPRLLRRHTRTSDNMWGVTNK